MKLPKNMKVCVLGVCVVALGVMLGSNIIDKNTPVNVENNVEYKVSNIELAKQDVIEDIEQAKVRAGIEDLVYNVITTDEGGLTVQINVSQDTFVYAKDYAVDTWLTLEETFTKVSGQLNSDLYEKYGENITVNIAIGDISKGDYYFLASDGIKVYSAISK